jgi:hypothetical protein
MIRNTSDSVVLGFGALLRVTRISSLDFSPHFGPVHWNVRWCRDAEPHFAANDVDDHDFDILPDHDRFVAMPAEN